MDEWIRWAIVMGVTVCTGLLGWLVKLIGEIEKEVDTIRIELAVMNDKVRVDPVKYAETITKIQQDIERHEFMFMKFHPNQTTLIALIAALAGVLTFGFTVAWATAAPTPPPSETVSSIPWGSWIASVVTVGAGYTGWFIGVVKGVLPGYARVGLEVLQLDQVITRSMQSAMFDFADEVKDNKWDFDLRNRYLKAVIDTVQVNASGLARRHKDSIVQKVKARIQEYIDKQ